MSDNLYDFSFCHMRISKKTGGRLLRAIELADPSTAIKQVGLLCTKHVYHSRYSTLGAEFHGNGTATIWGDPNHVSNFESGTVVSFANYRYEQLKALVKNLNRKIHLSKNLKPFLSDRPCSVCGKKGNTTALTSYVSVRAKTNTHVRQFCWNCLNTGGAKHTKGHICHLCRQPKADRLLLSYIGEGLSYTAPFHFRVHNKCVANLHKYIEKRPECWAERTIRLKMVM